MALIKTVTVGDRIIDLFTFQGEVLDEKKWATTQVSGSGGGGDFTDQRVAAKVPWLRQKPRM
jgi:hypothetical protein